jgi:hypothetical protein
MKCTNITEESSIMNLKCKKLPTDDANLRCCLPLIFSDQRKPPLKIDNIKAQALLIGLLLGDGSLNKKGYFAIEQASLSLTRWIHN